ncbi:hypothetical protein GJ496_004103, partial [Pomphorhynchus laevis]
DFRRVFFAVKRTGKLRRRLYDDMHNRSFWRKFNSTPWPPYAQKYKESLTVTAEGLEDFKNGWNVYLRFAEFERMVEILYPEEASMLNKIKHTKKYNAPHESDCG